MLPVDVPTTYSTEQLTVSAFAAPERIPNSNTTIAARYFLARILRDQSTRDSLRALHASKFRSELSSWSAVNNTQRTGLARLINTNVDDVTSIRVADVDAVIAEVVRLASDRYDSDTTKSKTVAFFGLDVLSLMYVNHPPTPPKT